MEAVEMSVRIKSSSQSAKIDKIVVRSNDRELLKKTWSINSKDGLEPWVINEIRPDGFAELTIFLKEQYSTLPFVVGLLEFIEARIKLTGSHTRAEFHVTNYSARLQKLVAAYYDRVDIEVRTDKSRLF